MDIGLLSDAEKAHIRDSWRIVQQAALMETATELFYQNLFETHPEYRAQFPADMAGQTKKLAKTLDFAVAALDWSSGDWQTGQVDTESDLFVILTAMGRRHKRLYLVTNDQYDPVGGSLLFALNLGLGVAFTPEVKSAWVKLYTMIADTMQLGTIMILPEDIGAEQALNPASGAGLRNQGSAK